MATRWRQMVLQRLAGIAGSRFPDRGAFQVQVGHSTHGAANIDRVTSESKPTQAALVRPMHESRTIHVAADRIMCARPRLAAALT
jgi:hypothetical protein